MPKTSELCDHLMDRLAPLGAPSYKFMFGGFGIYLDGLMMGIVSHDVLWLLARQRQPSGLRGARAQALPAHGQERTDGHHALLHRAR